MILPLVGSVTLLTYRAFDIHLGVHSQNVLLQVALGVKRAAAMLTIEKSDGFLRNFLRFWVGSRRSNCSVDILLVNLERSKSVESLLTNATSVCLKNKTAYHKIDI